MPRTAARDFESGRAVRFNTPALVLTAALPPTALDCHPPRSSAAWQFVRDRNHACGQLMGQWPV